MYEPSSVLSALSYRLIMFCQLVAEEQWLECTIQALASERPRLPLSANNLTALINVYLTYLLNIYECDLFGTSSLNDNIIKTQTVLIMQAWLCKRFLR